MEREYLSLFLECSILTDSSFRLLRAVRDRSANPDVANLHPILVIDPRLTNRLPTRVIDSQLTIPRLRTRLANLSSLSGDIEEALEGIRMATQDTTLEEVGKATQDTNLETIGKATQDTNLEKIGKATQDTAIPSTSASYPQYSNIS